jgi:hypothetical protein
MVSPTKCNVCMEELDLQALGVNAIYMNGVWTDRDCFSDVVLRVFQQEDTFPVKMNNIPIDLAMNSHHVEDGLL